MGLPAKSGVAGAILLVVPNVMGICAWSPSLDVCGNSVRGVQFYEVRHFTRSHFFFILHNSVRVFSYFYL